MSNLATMAEDSFGISSGVSQAGMCVGEGLLGAGISVGIGELYGRRKDKWYGRQAPWLALAIGKGVAALAHVFTDGNGGMVASFFNVVGQSGADAVGLGLGLDHAHGGATAALPKKTAVGALPPAAAGRGLTWAQLSEIAQMS